MSKRSEKIALLSEKTDNYTWEPIRLFLQTLGYSYIKIFNHHPLNELDSKIIELMQDYDTVITYGQGNDWFGSLLAELNISTIYLTTVDQPNLLLDNLEVIRASDFDFKVLSQALQKIESL